VPSYQSRVGLAVEVGVTACQPISSLATTTEARSVGAVPLLTGSNRLPHLDSDAAIALLDFLWERADRQLAVIC
jgi:hypothetical protein